MKKSSILLVVGMGLLCACCSMEKHETYAGKVELKPLKGERYLPEEEFTYPQVCFLPTIVLLSKIHAMSAECLQ